MIDKQEFLKRGLAAADWFVNSQVRVEKGWRADQDCFLYYYFMPEKKWVPGINWTHGRALFVLSEAYKVTGEEKYRESAERGARFVMALQPLDPVLTGAHGAIAEQTPNCNWGGMLDGAQAASGMIMLYRVTGNAEYLRRGRAFCDFLIRNWDQKLGFPTQVNFFPEKVIHVQHGDPGLINTMAWATAIPLWHLYKATGERRYLPLVVESADRILACQRPEGCINYKLNPERAPEPRTNHHQGVGEGDQKYILRNDDSIVVPVLAAYFATGEEKYLDAMVRYADWTVENEPFGERPYCAFGLQAANVLDIGRAAGKDYSAWVEKHLETKCFKFQVSGTGDPKADGGFCGEDEEGDAGVFGGKGTDYVPTRNTCYMALMLFRLAGVGNGSGFGVYGLGEDEAAKVRYIPGA
ncbi:MAG: hypothetical protein ACYTGB_19425 [Planctomycetota bacterium]|jgi:rhamnogalacturonyl hydrolase YesR